MLSADFEYSDFCQSIIIGNHDVDIEIFREIGTFAWTLENASRWQTCGMAACVCC